MISREDDNNLSKQETSRMSSDDHGTGVIRPSLLVASSSTWSRFKDPRVVRVPKAFGGKDRHSKVCTVRGLRDRRVRLSIPTAIQLYDLQDRLGVNQPSKVFDWLLDVAKPEIDELPPLQIPPGSSLQQIMASQVDHYSLSLSGSTTNWNNNPSKHPRPSGLAEDKNAGGDNMSWERDEENQDAYAADGLNFPSRNQQHLLGLMSGSIVPYNSYSSRYDEPNSSLSLRSHGPTAVQAQEDCGNLISPVPMAIPHHHQVLVCQHGMNTESYIPSHFGDPKQVNFQGSASSSSSSLVESSSSTQQVRPIHFMNMTASLFPSPNDEDAYQQKAKETYNHFH